jgi:hypothetical protein
MGRSFLRRALALCNILDKLDDPNRLLSIFGATCVFYVNSGTWLDLVDSWDEIFNQFREQGSNSMGSLA